MNHQTWPIEKIKEGFERFMHDNARLPTALEIDNLDYLPNRKFIERNYGGLEKLRGLLGYADVHLGKGAYRSKIASASNVKGREEELKLENLLVKKFGVAFVHTEKIFDDTKNRVDFFVYSPSGNFGVDIFHTETMNSLQGNLNIKLNKYLTWKGKLFFVVAGSSFTQRDLDSYVMNKSRKMPEESRLVTIEEFKKIVEEFSIYPQPF